MASLEAQLIRNPPAMPETQVLSLGGEGPLEKEMVIHSNILAWKVGYCPWGRKDLDMT